MTSPQAFEGLKNAGRAGDEYTPDRSASGRELRFESYSFGEALTSTEPLFTDIDDGVQDGDREAVGGALCGTVGGATTLDRLLQASRALTLQFVETFAKVAAASESRSFSAYDQIAELRLFAVDVSAERGSSCGKGVMGFAGDWAGD